jgi:hypothetical protein
MLFKEIIAVYTENNTKPISTVLMLELLTAGSWVKLES